MSFTIHLHIANVFRETRASNCPRPALLPRIWSPTIVSCTAEGPDSPALSPGKGFGNRVNRKEKSAADSKKRGSGNGLEEQTGVLLRGGKNAVPVEKEGSSKLNRLVNVLDKKSSQHSRIDPVQAKLGKVDFVRVQNWGSEEETDLPKLEDLKVKSFSPAVTSAPGNEDGPFYEKLVNRLQLLESKGEITVAQVKPLPSFDRWVFGEDRYIQFLVDQRSVFEALRDSIGAIRKERCRTVCGKLEEIVPLSGAASAVGLFHEELGLDRCEALSADLTSILSSSDKKGQEVESLTTTTQAVGYAKYLKQLGKTSLSDGEKARESCLRLLAHLFAIYASHLTTGMRIGTKAMDNVASLRQAKALRFYRDYSLQGQDPLKVFRSTINSAGNYIISDDQHEQVMEELSKAFQRTSLLLSVLAVEEPTVVAHD